MSLSSGTIDVKGRPTEILSAGTGEPLVFLHGGGMVEGFDFLEAVADRFRVIAPLQPGYGQTELDPPLTNRDALAEHVRDVLDALGIEQTVLIGHSLGGWRAASTAARFPERVSVLVLAAPFGMEVPENPPTNMMALSPQERLVALTNKPEVWEGRVPDGPDPEFAAARAREMESMSRFMTGPFDPDLASVTVRIAMPTLLLWGDEDGIIPFAHARAWSEAISQAPLEVFPATGHLLFHERPEALLAVQAFVGANRA